MSGFGRLSHLLADCHDDYDLFNSAVLGRAPYWSKQVEICESVVENRVTLVPAANEVGKTYVASGILLAFLATHSDALVISTAPTQTQLQKVLWKEILSAYTNSLVPIGGTVHRQPLKIAFGPKHFALGYSTTRTERLAGHHSRHLLVIVDEASGVAPEVYEALDSLDPSRILLIGNPLRATGVFADRCEAARKAPKPGVKLIRVSAHDSPDVRLERSERGLASKGFLDAARDEYGEGSLWWTTHIDALFPGQDLDAVIPAAWLALAEDAPRVRFGPTRMAIDLGEGRGGDRTVIAVRDDNVLLALVHSRDWSFEVTATKAALLAQQFGVEGQRVSWDAVGIGADFLSRLEAVGIKSARAYRGGSDGGTRFGNLRTAAAWRLRQRLDPGRTVPTHYGGPHVTQRPFAIARHHMDLVRPELVALEHEQDGKDVIWLQDKEELKKALKHSPDFADTLCQLFAF